MGKLLLWAIVPVTITLQFRTFALDILQTFIYNFINQLGFKLKKE